MPIDKRWKENFNPYLYDDYKEAGVERERLRQANSLEGWIYVGVCATWPGMSKIGMTAGKLGTRASGEQNPFYDLLCAFKVLEGTSSEKIEEIEGSTKAMLRESYRCELHRGSGRPSEWFHADPAEFRGVVHDFLYQHYCTYMYAYWCHEREVGVIHSWENPGLAPGGRRMYQATDWSSPPVAFECRMPPGCGQDCDCW